MSYIMLKEYQVIRQKCQPRRKKNENGKKNWNNERASINAVLKN